MWRLEPELLTAPELQVNPWKENIAGPDGAVEGPDSDDEATSTGGDSDTIQDTEDGLPWCPSLPEAMEDPTEEELSGAAEKLEIILEQQKTKPAIFFVPQNLGAPPELLLPFYMFIFDAKPLGR
jgi:hypothetical protein